MTMDLNSQTLGLVARANATDPLPGIGKQINQCKNVMKCIYDAPSLGGAAGDILLLDDQGAPAILPKGAVVTNVFAYVKTAPTVCTSIALKLLATADCMAATAIGSLTAGIFWKGKPVEPSAGAANTTAVGPVTAAGGTQMKVTIAGSTETTAHIVYIVEYLDIN